LYKAHSTEFVQEAWKKVGVVKEENWVAYATLSIKSAATKVNASGMQLNLADLVQSVTLKV
jgi:hypothetical protein